MVNTGAAVKNIWGKLSHLDESRFLRNNSWMEGEAEEDEVQIWEMMNKAAELKAVRIARKRVKPRLRVLLIYVSRNQPLLYGGVAGS
jgi:hypothetical protein